MVFITIPFYVIHNLNDSFLKGLMSPFNMSMEVQRSQGGIYVFFYNINPWLSDLYSDSVIRNSGFMWEPGAFGAMLIFLILYRFLFVDKLRISKTTGLLFLYSLTTFSTTTFFALFACLMLLLVHRFRTNIFKLSVYFGIALMIAIPVYNQPFIKGKIDLYLETNLDYHAVYDHKKKRTTKDSIGRLAGMLIEIDRVKSRPIAGYGWDDDYSSIGIGNHWTNPNGLADLLGKFGLVGMMLVGFGLFGFFPRSLKLNKLERALVLTVLLLPVFSNPLQLNPILWSIIMFGFVNTISSWKKKKPSFKIGQYIEARFNS